MDQAVNYRQIVQQLLCEYAAIPYAYGRISNEVVFDLVRDRYMVVAVGWQRGQREYGPVIHIDLVDGQLWLQANHTDQNLVEELVALGVKREDIFVAFQQPDLLPFVAVPQGVAEPA